MLSKREREILSLVCFTNKQIARRTGLSWRTIEKMFAAMREKFRVKTRIKLLIEAVRAGEIKVIDCGSYDAQGRYTEDFKEVILNDV